MKEAIDRKFGEGWSHVDGPGTVKITLPSSFRDDPVSFASAIENLTLSVEDPNCLVINERTGTIIVGNKVRVSPITISQGNLRIEVAPQPGAATKPQGGRQNEAPKGSLINLSGETTVDDLVKSLNAVGATPKDLIAIFQAIDAAGALHGQLKIM